MKIKNYGISLAMILIICFSFFTPALAANDWMVEEDDELVFDLTVWDEDDITADGSFTLTIEDIDSTAELTYSIKTDFEIDDDDLEDSMEVDDATTTTTVNIMWLVVLLWSEDSFDDYIDDIDDYVENMEDSYDTLYGDNDSIIYSVVELEYGFDLNLEDTELEEKMHWKMQWDEKGILKIWEITMIEDNDKSGILIRKKGFDIMGIINSIPGYPLGLVLGIFTITTVGIIIINKKRN